MLYLYSKRLLDLIIATLVLIICFPLFIVIMILLKFTGDHEVFFLQKRIGYQNKPFYIWKFSSMIRGAAELGGGVITVRNDWRVTKVGRFLRITKINELPQIINVFRGEMTIVGPRPLMEVSFNLYSDEVKQKIYNCKPGITGVGSLVFRDEEKILSKAVDPEFMYTAIYPYKGKLELWYQNHASLATDVTLIFLTAWTIPFPANKLMSRIFSDLPPSHSPSFGGKAEKEEKFWIPMASSAAS